MKMEAICEERCLGFTLCLFFPSQTENDSSTSTSKPDIPESKFIPRPSPALAGAYDMTDIKTLLREWVTSITGMQ